MDLQSHAVFLWMEYRRPGLRRVDVGRRLARGFDPTFTIVPGAARNAVYILRLVVGLVMLASSLDWLIDASTLLREPVAASVSSPFAQEKTA